MKDTSPEKNLQNLKKQLSRTSLKKSCSSQKSLRERSQQSNNVVNTSESLPEKTSGIKKTLARMITWGSNTHEFDSKDEGQRENQNSTKDKRNPFDLKSQISIKEMSIKENSID